MSDEMARRLTAALTARGHAPDPARPIAVPLVTPARDWIGTAPAAQPAPAFRALVDCGGAMVEDADDAPDDDANAAPEVVLRSIATCRKYICTSQMNAMLDGIRGEEGDFFRGKFVELARLFASMPKTYQQDGLGDKAVVHLHYFKGAADWFITERDKEVVQYQAFGLADLFGDGGELGYISIVELIQNGVELDLYWTPKTLGTVRGER